VGGVVDFSGISAVLVTRGDVDITTILNSLPFDDVVVWNNAEREDLQCYGRFAGIAEAEHEWIYIQDDDLLVPIPALVREWRAEILPFWKRYGDVFANVRPDEEWRLTACGAIFHRSTLSVFDRYIEVYGRDADFFRVADVVHAYQLPFHRRWYGYLDFPWQTAPNRMYHQPDHYTVRERARDRALALVA
jgi:hypothetical protein